MMDPFGVYSSCIAFFKLNLPLDNNHMKLLILFSSEISLIANIINDKRKVATEV